MLCPLLFVWIGCNIVWRRQITCQHHSVSHVNVRWWEPISILIDNRCSARCCSNYVQQWHDWIAEGRDADSLQHCSYDGNIQVRHVFLYYRNYLAASLAWSVSIDSCDSAETDTAIRQPGFDFSRYAFPHYPWPLCRKSLTSANVE